MQVREHLRELVLEEPHTAPKAAERIAEERLGGLPPTGMMQRGGATSFGTVGGELGPLEECEGSFEGTNTDGAASEGRASPRGGTPNGHEGGTPLATTPNDGPTPPRLRGAERVRVLDDKSHE